MGRKFSTDSVSVTDEALRAIRHAIAAGSCPPDDRGEALRAGLASGRAGLRPKPNPRPGPLSLEGRAHAILIVLTDSRLDLAVELLNELMFLVSRVQEHLVVAIYHTLISQRRSILWHDTTVPLGKRKRVYL